MLKKLNNLIVNEILIKEILENFLKIQSGLNHTTFFKHS